MPKHQYTIAEMEKQIADLQATMKVPGIPEEELQIYRATITRIGHVIALQKQTERNPAAPPMPPTKTPEKITQQIRTANQSHAVTPPIGGGAGGGVVRALTMDEYQSNPPAVTPIKTRHAGPAPTAAPITSRIEVEHNTDPHNPRITITWSDHYTITVDETAARSNFTNRMRDTCNLKCVVKESRLEKIWKYDAPWRAAGFYQALTWFWDGKPPALIQIGVTRPTETYKKIFALITAQAQDVL